MTRDRLGVMSLFFQFCLLLSTLCNNTFNKLEASTPGDLLYAAHPIVLAQLTSV